jgi:hypothetical protein
MRTGKQFVHDSFIGGGNPSTEKTTAENHRNQKQETSDGFLFMAICS